MHILVFVYIFYAQSHKGTMFLLEIQSCHRFENNNVHVSAFWEIDFPVDS